MKRFALEKLKEWKTKPNRKPLIIRGARQVGKTWLMKEFGRLYYTDTVYINFDSNSIMTELFASDLVGLSDRALTAGGEAAAAEQTVSALAVRCMGGAGGAIDGACVYLWKGYFSAAPPLGGNGETDGGAGVVLGLYCFL